MIRTAVRPGLLNAVRAKNYAVAVWTLLITIVFNRFALIIGSYRTVQVQELVPLSGGRPALLGNGSCWQNRSRPPASMLNAASEHQEAAVALHHSPRRCHTA